MNKATEKAKREQENEYVVEGSAVAVKNRKTGEVLSTWNMAALPVEIINRILGQGGSTILQQRKSGKNGAEAIAIMNAHYANWMAGNWEMERKQVLPLPGWVFPALCLKMPQVAPVKILASLEAKRASATLRGELSEWQTFLTSLLPYKRQLEESGEGSELVSLD
jgi:hypothetical protein